MLTKALIRNVVNICQNEGVKLDIYKKPIVNAPTCRLEEIRAAEYETLDIHFLGCDLVPNYCIEGIFVMCF